MKNSTILLNYVKEVSITTVAIAIIVIFLSIIEKILPSNTAPSTENRLGNFYIFMICDVLIASAISFPIILFTQQIVQSFNGSFINFDLVNIANGYNGITRLFLENALSFVPLFLYDFFFYWWHRWQHTNPWIWQEHKLHHADACVNVTTSRRRHFLSAPLLRVFTNLPWIVAFSFTPTQAVVASAIIMTWEFFIHTNLRIRFGILSFIMVGPQYHRIHHSIDSKHQNKNFAAWFPFWDILFGTYYHPSWNEFPKTGVIGEEPSPSLRQAIMTPFISWLRMIKQLDSRD